jgi:hypothetical protein
MLPEEKIKEYLYKFKNDEYKTVEHLIKNKEKILSEKNTKQPI